MEIKDSEKTEDNSLTEMLGNIMEKIDNLDNSMNSNIPSTEEETPTEEEPPDNEAPPTEEI